MLTDDLAETLGAHPGLNAHELARLLAERRGRHAGRGDGREISLALASATKRFCCDRSDPPRWWLAGDFLASSPAALRQLATPCPAVGSDSALGELRLYAWQVEALTAWARRGHRGVVEAVTGTGKTVLGLAAVSEQLRDGGQALVLVPTIELMRQWRREIHRLLGPQLRVGCLGGSESASFVTHDVVVAVVNSARASALRPIRRDGLLVADECHRYASGSNRLALGAGFGRRLGLSATYARDDGAHLDWLEPYFGGTCFEMGYRRAATDGVTARFSLALLGVQLAPWERQRYDELTAEIGARLARLVERHGIAVDPFSALLRALEQLAARRFPSDAQAEARALLAALHERRRLLADTRAKLEGLLALVPAMQVADRSLVFTQSIAVAERAQAALGAAQLRVGAVHSQLPSSVRAETLGRFAAGHLDVVVAPRVLDEGIDVPEADLAVIIGASRSRRQMVQRMGRVLRRKPSGHRARIAVLFAVGTVEDPACGAHETFLSEVTEVADESRVFRTARDWEAAASFLCDVATPASPATLAGRQGPPGALGSPAADSAAPASGCHRPGMARSRLEPI